MDYPNLQPGNEAALPPSEPSGHPRDRHDLGATEDQVNMRATVPQRVDPQGHKIEDMAGNGEVDAKGG